MAILERHRIDPVELAEQVEERYKRYLETTFYFKDPDLRKSFQGALSSGHLSKGPYLEATPVFKCPEGQVNSFKNYFLIHQMKGS